MRIKLLEVGAVYKENKYYILPIKYDEGGKEKDKKIFSFDEVPYKALKGANVGQMFDVKLEKKDGFWKWTEITEAAAGAAPVAGTATRSSSYETPEERARRQVLIVRQNALTNAVSSLQGTEGVSVQAVLDLAADFEAWVTRG